MGLGWAALRAFLLLRSHFPLPQIRWALFYPLLFTFLLCSPWILVPHRMPVEFVSTLPVVLFLLLTSWKWIQRPGSHRAAALAALATGLILYAYYGTKPLAFTQPPSPWRHTVLSAASLPTINVDLCGSLGTRGGG